MKTKLLLAVILSFYFNLLSSQVPQGLNYQALAGDVSGNPIRNTDLQVKISILSDTIIPVILWEELHSTVRTNLHGIFSLVVGSGVRQTASSVAKFSEINWTATQLFIRTHIYYQSSWKSMGSAKLWTVPYSMVAGDLSGAVKKLAVTGNTSSLDEALFEVKNKNGQTVFAVYNEGVRVYVDDGAKGAKGGFAIGGFDMSKGLTNEYLFISPDSARIYIDKAQSTKGAKGGFAIGGFDMTKAPDEEYLRVTRDSTRVYINDTPSKTRKGGFAIGGFSTNKGDINNFLDLTPLNYFIGHNSGKAITSGLYNSSLGYESGLNISSGESNAFIGYQSGYNNRTGSGNLFLGYQSGFSNKEGKYNTFLGYISGYSNTSGLYNTFLGSFSGHNNIYGSNNTFIGDSTGFFNVVGENNTFLGTHTGKKNVSGIACVFIGNKSGYNNLSGYSNVFVGNECGYNNTTGRDNIFMGTRSGWSNTTGWENVFLGWGTGFSNTTATLNVFIGSQTGSKNTTGEKNTLIGSYAGYKNIIGNNNTLIGCNAGNNLETGSDNVFFGLWAGYNSVNGARNVFIGTAAGASELGSNKLYIENSDADSTHALIYGDFEKKYLRLNALAIATGDRADPSGFCSFAGGQNTFATSDHSFAYGYKTIANAPGTVALGYETVATTGQSLAMGYLSHANGWASTAFGYGSKANSAAVFVIGRMNDTTNMTKIGEWIPTDPAFVIGNGTSNIDRKNALTVLQNSNVGINMSAPQQKLDIAGGNGRVESGYNWLTDSDIRFKKNISKLESAMQIVLQMRAVRYDLNEDPLSPSAEGKHIGFIAQELEKIVPEVVVTGSDGYKSVAYDKLTAVLTEAIKEQQKEIENQQKEIDDLKALVSSLIENQTIREDK